MIEYWLQLLTSFFVFAAVVFLNITWTLYRRRIHALEERVRHLEDRDA